MAYKRAAPVDICAHRILRQNCEFCEQLVVSQTPQEIKLMSDYRLVARHNFRDWLSANA